MPAILTEETRAAAAVLRQLGIPAREAEDLAARSNGREAGEIIADALRIRAGGKPAEPPSAPEPARTSYVLRDHRRPDLTWCKVIMPEKSQLVPPAPKPSKCENCGRKIGALETPCQWRGHNVCRRCAGILKEQGT